uniref:Putative secreted protein n=1 Tax=Anopheles darlingi TaxID=43151 RepID=A0A2M4DPR6_ANODA
MEKAQCYIAALCCSLVIGLSSAEQTDWSLRPRLNSPRDSGFFLYAALLIESFFLAKTRSPPRGLYTHSVVSSVAPSPDVCCESHVRDGTERQIESKREAHK